MKEIHIYKGHEHYIVQVNKEKKKEHKQDSTKGSNKSTKNKG